ncbi:MAG: hypothetical protein JWO80_1478, partial [Bryobacterales bacterium]|nr:hypothetical protein [Bryobacterales bacterium]
HPAWQRPGAVLIAAGLCSGILVQWAWSYSIGLQESRYRTGVGSYLRAVSRPSDSIMLEPVGYIPYFAQRYTHDARGLASPEVTRYRQKFGRAWWINYVRDFRPTYYVERTHLRWGQTLDRDQLTPPEIEWFRSNYEIIKTFSYRPEDFVKSELDLKLARFGTHDDYDVYRLRQTQ